MKLAKTEAMAGATQYAESSAAENLAVPGVACPLCHAAGARRQFFSGDRVHAIPGTFAIHRCDRCDAWFIQPWLAEAELLNYYPDEYGRYRHGGSLDKKSYRGWQHFVLENFYGYPAADGKRPALVKTGLAWLLSFFTAKGVIPYRGTGRILDVGCGGGGYLHRLKQWGWEAYGVEPSETGAKQAQSLGLTVKQGMLRDAGFETGFFDVVRLSNVLEHLPDPRETLQEIHRILRPEGIVYITVPNTRSLVFWLFERNWYSLDPPRHVISYSPKTLKFLAECTGFEVACMDFAAGPFNFVRSMKYLVEERGESWPRWLGQVRWERSKFIRRSLKPFFFFVDALGYGDFLHGTLKKKG